MDTILKDLLRVAGGLAALLVAPSGSAQEPIVDLTLPAGQDYIEDVFIFGSSTETDEGEIVVQAEGPGVWEATFVALCEPLELLPVVAPVPEKPATVLYTGRGGSPYFGEGQFRNIYRSPVPQAVIAKMTNHHWAESQARVGALYKTLARKQGVPYSDTLNPDVKFDEERPRLEREGLWAETEFWINYFAAPSEHTWTCPVLVRIERVRNRCSMSARVSGDVNGSVYGDVAYFNTFEQGAALTTGSYADTEMHQMLQGWAGAMGDMAEWAAQRGHSVDKKDLERLKRNEQGFSVAQEELHLGQTEMFEAGGDKFGLTLADTKFDAPTPTLEDGAMSDAAKQHLDIARSAAGQGDVEGALASILGALGGALGDAQKSGQLDALGQGIGAMAGLFTLEASAPGNYPDVPHGSITLPLSSLVVAPGAIDDVGRVPFIYSKEHGVGQAMLEIVPIDQNLIVGHVSGELYTEGTYSNLGRKGKIKVEAQFVALRGVNSCH